KGRFDLRKQPKNVLLAGSNEILDAARFHGVDVAGLVGGVLGVDARINVDRVARAVGDFVERLPIGAQRQRMAEHVGQGRIGKMEQIAGGQARESKVDVPNNKLPGIALWFEQKRVLTA